MNKAAKNLWIASIFERFASFCERGHPFMKLNEECAVYDCFGVGFDCYILTQFYWDWGQCEMGLDGSSNVDTKTIDPPKNETGLMWRIRRGSIIGPSTINHGMGIHSNNDW